MSLIPLIPPLLYFPSPPPPIDTPAPDDFTLQYWPDLKITNTSLVLSLIRILVNAGSGSSPNQSAMSSSGVTRCLIELSLSSNAPPLLKAQALTTLVPILGTSPPNQSLLTHLSLAPLVSVPATEQHPAGGFVRLPMRSAVLALIGSIVEGGGDIEATEGEEVADRDISSRAAGIGLFEAYITGNAEGREMVLHSMDTTLPPEGLTDPERPYDPPVQTAGNLLLNAIIETPLPGRPIDPYRILFACLLVSHLIRGSEKGKEYTRNVKVPTGTEGDDDQVGPEDEESETLLQVVVGNLLLAQREQAAARLSSGSSHPSTSGPASNSVTPAVPPLSSLSGTPNEEEKAWDKIMVGYLVLLSTWLWDSPKTVRAFLDESDLQVVSDFEAGLNKLSCTDVVSVSQLIAPITQSTGVDPLVQGLSAFVLGVCYEFNREPGEVTRSVVQKPRDKVCHLIFGVSVTQNNPPSNLAFAYRSRSVRF